VSKRHFGSLLFDFKLRKLCFKFIKSSNKFLKLDYKLLRLDFKFIKSSNKFLKLDFILFCPTSFFNLPYTLFEKDVHPFLFCPTSVLKRMYIVLKKDVHRFDL
jgi:hypothetical protein